MSDDEKRGAAVEPITAHDDDKTEPNTIRALAKQITDFERANARQMHLILHEVRRQGGSHAQQTDSINELKAAFLDHVDQFNELKRLVESHVKWEHGTMGAQGSEPKPNGGDAG